MVSTQIWVVSILLIRGRRTHSSTPLYGSNHNYGMISILLLHHPVPRHLLYKVITTTKSQVRQDLITLCAGQISTTLTSLFRTVDEYSETAKNEPNPVKQEKARERIKIFRAEILEFRQRFEGLKNEREEVVRSSSIGSKISIADRVSLTYSKRIRTATSFLGAGPTMPAHPKIPML